MCKFDGRVERIGIVNELIQIPLAHRCRNEAVIDVPAVVLGFGTGVRKKNLSFQMTHEQTSIARPHFGAHGYAATLLEVCVIKLKGVEGEDKFS